MFKFFYVDFGDDVDAGSVVPLAIPKRYFDAKSVFVGNISIAGIVHSAPLFGENGAKWPGLDAIVNTDSRFSHFAPYFD